MRAPRVLAGIVLVVLAAAPALPAKGRKGLPPEYANHTGGIVHPVAEADLAAAVALGISSKDKPRLDAAYTFKPNLSTTVRVITPLFLAAHHAKTAAEEYREPDPGFLEFCRGLTLVKLAAETWTRPTPELRRIEALTVILLRDGTRVPSIRELPSYGGTNPYLEWSLGFAGKAIADQLRAQAQETAARLRSEGHMVIEGSPAVVLPEQDAVYAIEEIRKPGRYEIVLRPDIRFQGPYPSQAGESRHPIDFSSFR